MQISSSNFSLSIQYVLPDRMWDPVLQPTLKFFVVECVINVDEIMLLHIMNTTKLKKNIAFVKSKHCVDKNIFFLSKVRKSGSCKKFGFSKLVRIRLFFRHNYHAYSHLENVFLEHFFILFLVILFFLVLLYS